MKHDLHSPVRAANEVGELECHSSSDETFSEPHPTAPEGFSVRDEGTANWLIRKVLEARHYAEQVASWAQRELRRAEREEQFLLYRFGQQLEDWTRRQLAAPEDMASRGRKSIHLPAGSVGFRREPAKLLIVDERALTEWCRVHLPSATAVVQHVHKAAVKEHVAATGELPPGAELREGGERFFIK
jgi:hypothetical protein